MANKTERKCNLYCFTVICMVVVGLHTSDCTTIKWKVGKTIGVRFLNPFAEKPHHSHTSCVHLCLAIGGCFVANYHPGSRTCALVDGSQTSNAYDETWHAYEVISGKPSLLFLYAFQPWNTWTFKRSFQLEFV